MKTFVVGLLCTSFALACTKNSDREGPEPTLTPTEQTIRVGESFTVSWELNSGTALLNLTERSSLRWDRSVSGDIIEEADDAIDGFGNIVQEGELLESRYELTFRCLMVGDTMVELEWVANAVGGERYRGSSTAMVRCAASIPDGGADASVDASLDAPTDAPSIDAGPDGGVRRITLVGPTAMAASPSGEEIRVADATLGSVLSLAKPSASTGDAPLEVVTGRDFQADGMVIGTGPDLESPMGLTTIDATTSLVVDEDAGTLVRVDHVERTRTVVSGGGVGSGPDFESPESVEYDAGFAYVFNRPFGGAHSIYRVNPTTGERVEVWRGRTGFLTAGFELDTVAGRFLTFIGNDLWAIDAVTGADSMLFEYPNGPGERIFGGLVIDHTTNRLAVISSSLDGVSFIDLSTGDVLVVSDSGRGTGPEFVSLTALLYYVAEARIFVTDSARNVVTEVDTNTGDRADTTMGE